MQSRMALFVLLAVTSATHALNGFELENASIPVNEIVSGGPPRDGIPALDHPKVLGADKATYMRDQDLVLGVAINGQARAYPTRILVWHEIVNDTLGGKPVAVTFCPLCGSGVVFDRGAPAGERFFGVSGLLYNSDMLLYDRATDSLWTQIRGEAVSGPLRGTTLAKLPVVHTSWQDWQRRHPHTSILSLETGHARDYDHYPYEDYESAFTLFFPVSERNRRYHPKELVIGVAEGRTARVWPFAELAKSSGAVQDTFNGRPVTVHFNDEEQSAEVRDDQGNLLAATTLFWFAWYTFYPHTSVYSR